MDRFGIGKNQGRSRLLVIGAAVIVLIVALVLYVKANDERIMAQNSLYLETSTDQTAERVDDAFEAYLEDVRASAFLCEQMLDGPSVDPARAVRVLEYSRFDHTFFVSPDGTAYSTDDRTGDASNLEYFERGMAGQSGICFIEDAVFDDESVVAFFSSVERDGEVLGVTVATYRQSSLASLITTEFNGISTPTFICTPQGRIVAQAASTWDHADTIDELFQAREIEGLSLAELDADIELGKTVDFTYHGSSGMGNAYMVQLPTSGWMLLRSFPSTISTEMVTQASVAGAIIVAGVVIAAAMIIVVLVIQGRREAQELMLESREAERIIDASTNLFNRMLSIDLLEGSYEYLKNDGSLSGIPLSGTYEQLRERLGTLTDYDREGSADLVLLSPERIAQALKDDVPFVQQEWWSHRDDGDSHCYQVSTLCLTRDGVGHPTAVLVTVQDITAAKLREMEAHDALEEAFHAAEHASQAKSDFLNSMSHDIRTPMNSIMGLTAIATMHVDEPERVRECLANITSASKHLLGLINEVLDMAKIEAGTIGLSEEPFNLSESIESLVSVMNPQIEAKHQQLEVDLVDIKHEHVMGDPTRLQQVFVNIMGNSVKFTPEGGKVGLRITELPSRIAGSGCYEFVFTDTGVGMSEEFVKKVFEPFARANDSRTTKVEGTGLGMAIVKSVVSLMSGSVDVESEVGRGTTITVMVHLTLRDAEEENLEGLQGVRVLVVDDDSIACEGACVLLDDIGMRSAFALSGPEGVDSVVEAEEQLDPFRAVILDWRMPGMSGIECAKQIRERVHDDVPIIILSAYDWSVIEQEAREVGVDAFISKPLFRSRLVQVMKELVSGEKRTVLDEKALLEGLEFHDRRILLTEDNAMAAAIACELIGLTGAQVDHAENGRIALEMLQDHEPGHYDMVLMDIQMPVMNGYEATSAIRQAARTRPDLGQIPIIALSADAFAEDVHRAKVAGMNDHMAKPFEVETLVRMLRKWVLQ